MTPTRLRLTYDKLLKLSAKTVVEFFIAAIFLFITSEGIMYKIGSILLALGLVELIHTIHENYNRLYGYDKIDPSKNEKPQDTNSPTTKLLVALVYCEAGGFCLFGLGGPMHHPPFIIALLLNLLIVMFFAARLAFYSHYDRRDYQIYVQEITQSEPQTTPPADFGEYAVMRSAASLSVKF